MENLTELVSVSFAGLWPVPMWITGRIHANQWPDVMRIAGRMPENTHLGNVAALGYYIYYYLSGKSLVKIKLKFISGEKKIWGQTFGIGIPAALSQFLMSGALIVLNNFAKSVGSESAFSISSIIFAAVTGADN